MNWVMRELIPGDHIRVNRGPYHHHGVYIGNGEVIHYTGQDSDSIDRPENVEVKKTSIEFFSRGTIVEVAELSLKEKLYSRNRKARVQLAINSIGEKGYNFLHNNCETFANKVCYKKQLSSQVEDFKKTL